MKESKEKNDPKPKIIHFGWGGQKQKAGKEKHGGVMTVAFREAVPGLILLGFSFCSPSDNFSKQKGGRDALQRMRTKSIAFRYLGPLKYTLQNVIDALCTRRFEQLEFFCGHPLRDVLWYVKHIRIKIAKDMYDNRIEECCIVPGWAAKWWEKQPASSPLSLVHIGDLAKAGIEFGLKPYSEKIRLTDPPPEVKKAMMKIDEVVMREIDAKPWSKKVKKAKRGGE